MFDIITVKNTRLYQNTGYEHNNWDKDGGLLFWLTLYSLYAILKRQYIKVTRQFVVVMKFLSHVVDINLAI